jgi:ribose transport system substrate-binding protein
MKDLPFEIVRSLHSICRRPWLVACLAIATFVTGCGSKSDSGAPATGGSSAKHTIAVIPKGTTHIFWQSVHAGAQKAGEELGYAIQWNGPERETDRERQIQIIEDFIVQKVDGIVLAPLDRKALVPSVEKLASLKIP